MGKRPRCGRCDGPNGMWYRKIDGKDGLICDPCREKELRRKAKREKMTDEEWYDDINARIQKLLAS